MQRNIITEVMENFSPEFISKAAHALQETENGVSRGLENLIPSIFYQLNHHLDRSDANQFFQLLKKEKNISFMNQLDSLLKGNKASSDRKSITGNFIEKLFGNQFQEILDFVSQRNQIKTKSTQSLMTIAGALVMGHLSKMIRKDGLKLDTLKSTLLGQQNNIEAALPKGMINWLGNIRPLATATRSSSNNKGAATVAYASKGTAATSAGAVESSSSVAKYLWLLPFLLLLLGGWYFLSPSSTTNSEANISQKENNISPVKRNTTTVEEVKDELVLATEKIAEEHQSEATTSNTISTINAPIASSNTNSTETKRVVKEESKEIVTISEPELIEEINLEIPSSPGKVDVSENMSTKGGGENNNANTKLDYSKLSGASVSADAPSVKVSYEDYIENVKMPEQRAGALAEIKKETLTVLPEWYTKSKNVVNGNSSHVTVIKKTETIIDGRNTTSDALSELRKSLSLTTYNAWFGHITNPISSTEYRFYSYLTGKQSNAYQTDKYTWFTLDKVSFPNYDSKMDFNASKGQLGRIANILSANPDVTLRLGGFTSDLGKKKDNRALSFEMAEQTKAALVQLGVAENRISVKGYGERNPLGLNDTEWGRMKNHRVGFRVLSK